MGKKKHWTEDERNCYQCGGAGYVQRHDRSRIKCLHCNGTGRKLSGASNGSR